MKTALITTTINVPTVLELYRQHGPDVAFFVAGDQKSPHEEICALAATRINGDFLYMSPNFQTDWKCSELIGWNCIQRRNIALLEAIKWGADVIVSIDDDNIPNGDGGVGGPYFWWFQRLLGGYPFRGVKVSSARGWFDVGRLLEPYSPHRGYPLHYRNDLWRADPVSSVKVGVAAGICLGDPDIGATTRMENAPEVHRVSQLLESGIVVDPQTKTVFNSQNTAFIRELAPAMFMMPGVGRYDDIYASLICQRVMRERGLHVHFGKPFVWQQRNPHNLVRDLRQEIDGMESIERFGAWLDSRYLQTDGTVLADVRQIYAQAPMLDWMPKQSIVAALAFLEDIEEVLG